jgi:polyferredoxin
MADPIRLLALTVVLFALFYLLLLSGVYLARRYLPEAHGLYDTVMEPFLIFPAAVLAFVVALALRSSIK